MQSLGHLNALKAFEAAARYLSFTEAASELGVTSAAVGLHVRTLEAYLGIKLFIRAQRRLVLSEDASAVVAEIREGLDKLSGAMNRLHEQARKPILTVTVPPSFGSKWLMPRLEQFRSENPTINLRVDTAERPMDLRRENVDLGIRFGSGPYAGLLATPLLDEWVVPVCSPLLLAQYGPALCPTDLAGTTLIHDTSVGYDNTFPTWKSWFKQAGIADGNRARGISVNSSILAVQAALEGQGIALGRGVLVADEMKAGRLVRAFSDAGKVEARYWIVQPAEKSCSRSATIFRTWILLQASAFRKTMMQSLKRK